MSEVVLRAVAQAIAELESKMQTHVDSIESRIKSDERETIPRQEVDLMIQQVKAMYEGLSEETIEIREGVLRKSEELREEVISLSNDILNKMTSKFSEQLEEISERLTNRSSANELLVKSVREELQAVNDDTLTLTAKAIEKIEEQINFVDSQLNSEMQHATRALRDELVVKLESIELTPGPKGDVGSNGKDAAEVLAEHWQPGIKREGTTVQHYLGQYFRAKCDTISEPGVDDTWERIGTAGFRHRGGFDAQKAYEIGDLYVKDFATFACIGDKHVLFAARGPLGPKGEKGADSMVQGPKGEDGSHVKQVHTSEEGFVIEMSNGDMHAVPFPKSVAELFKSPSDYIEISRLKSIAASSSDFKSFQSALLDLK